jgi:trimeric autotransporter adhesin
VDPAPDGGYPNQNTAEGDGALSSLTSGIGNTAVGNTALQSTTTAADNTAIGWGALNANISSFNTAVGMFALVNNTTGANNTAVGQDALANNNGSANTAVGQGALLSNSTGSSNTAYGIQALFRNTTGFDNAATGGAALFSNTTGNANTATGAGALPSNTTGNANTATGATALNNNTTGHDNTAEGFQALARNTAGSSNIALGSKAGINLTTGNNNIDIGANVLGTAGESGKIRIGKQGTQNGTFIAGIFGVTMTGSPVVVNSSGKLGVSGTSSIRFKKAVKPMDKASEVILQLEPVTFRYKEEIDPDGIPQFGLVAEEVEKVNPDLITRDEEGKPTTVRYEAVNAMLLNEFLKEHRKVEEQECKAREQGTTIAQMKKQIEALTATVQKVSDQVALCKPAPQLVANP